MAKRKPVNTRTCTEGGCDKNQVGKGFCWEHYVNALGPCTIKGCGKKQVVKGF